MKVRGLLLSYRMDSFAECESKWTNSGLIIDEDTLDALDLWRRVRTRFRWRWLLDGCRFKRTDRFAFLVLFFEHQFQLDAIARVECALVCGWETGALVRGTGWTDFLNEAEQLELTCFAELVRSVAVVQTVLVFLNHQAIRFARSLVAFPAYCTVSD